MFRHKSFYITFFLTFIVIGVPNFLFQINEEKSFIKDKPLLAIAIFLIGSLIVTIAIHKIDIGNTKSN